MARVVLGVTGGIAAYKAALLLRLLTADGHEVQVVPTANALRMVGEATWRALSGRPVHTTVWEDPTEHVDLGKWADLVVVAPATANLLAKAAHGLADDLLSCTALATRAPLIIAPAMNVKMWEHPATRANVATLKARGATLVCPGEGDLACGYEGAGRMAEPGEIAVAIERVVKEGLSRKDAGK